MSAGSVTIAADGTETKSGLAEAIYDARLAMLADVDPPGVVPVGPAGYPLKHGLALGATADANAIFTYLLTNGEASGVIKVFAGAAAPSGYLLCDGTSYLRATYPDLFTAIGVTFGAVDGTHFNVPDLRGRAPIGSGTGDASDATAHTLGTKSGTEKHTLLSAELATHTHAVTDAGHAHEADAEKFVVKNAAGAYQVDAGTGYDVVLNTASATTGITLGNTGSNTPHNNMPPVLAVNFIIKT
jgi:microcystin-dependent protein